MSQAELWDFTVGIPVVIGIYIGGRRLTTVGVLPKPDRCIKHNRHGVFPVGITRAAVTPVSSCLIFCFFFFIILVLSLFSLFSPTSVYYLSSSSLFFRFFFHFVFTPRANSKKKKYVSDRNGHIHVQCIWFSSFIPSITFFSF